MIIFLFKCPNCGAEHKRYGSMKEYIELVCGTCNRDTQHYLIKKKDKKNV